MHSWISLAYGVLSMPRAYIPVEARELVVARAQGRCEYCQSVVEYATQSFDIDHIVPVSRGGTSAVDNLAFACSGCNSHKFNRLTAPDPVDGTDVPLFHPRQQRWQDHFGWTEDFTQVVGLTPSGRATVATLQLNRSGVVSLRRLLCQAGKHPPALQE